MFYETTILLSPQLSTDELYSLWETISQEVQKLGAKIEKEVKPFERTLAYPIKKGLLFRRVYLGILYLAPQKARKELAGALRELLKGQNGLIRFMIACVSSVPEQRRQPTPAKETIFKEPTKTPAHLIGDGSEKQKPSLENLDKKLEEILEDKISF